jgi:hypothetical protein
MLAMSKKKNTVPVPNIALYEALVHTIAGIELKGATMPYTSCNGHMFSFLDPEGNLALRLPDEKREVFLKKYKTRLCEAHGTILKEYALVPQSLFMKLSDLKVYFKWSYEYVKSLKPKAAKK